MAWSLLTPTDTDKIRAGDDKIRELKADIESCLSGEHSFPVLESAPVCYHKIPSGDVASMPAAGVAGRWYLVTDLTAYGDYVIFRDSGSAWVALTDIQPFPSGAISFFVQATPPTGWTRSAAADDRMLRVNSAAGGGTWGAWGITIAASDHAHGHGSVTDSGSVDASGVHNLTPTLTFGKAASGGYEVVQYSTGIGHTGSAHTHTVEDNAFNHGHSIASTWKPAYVDIIMATKA
jgi:hypothetical protein